MDFTLLMSILSRARVRCINETQKDPAAWIFTPPAWTMAVKSVTEYESKMKKIFFSAPPLDSGMKTMYLHHIVCLCIEGGAPIKMRTQLGDTTVVLDDSKK